MSTCMWPVHTQCIHTKTPGLFRWETPSSWLSQAPGWHQMIQTSLWTKQTWPYSISSELGEKVGINQKKKKKLNRGDFTLS